MLFMFECMYSFKFLGMQTDKHHSHSVKKKMLEKSKGLYTNVTKIIL